MTQYIIALAYVTSVWFFAKMWDKSKDEKYQYFYMFLTFLHVIGGFSIAMVEAGQNATYMIEILRVFINLDLVMLFATVIVVIATGTEKGVKIMKRIKNRMKELSS